ncbi:MAG: DUF1700 domain-containing protein [Ruminococcus sp.]|nr:DUF1700 domain-containing protein [Ruminococcus sp.]
MTKYDYLTRLNHYLQPLPPKDRNEAMKYYEKYFNDAGPANERYVIMNLGTPKQLAEKILSRNKHTISGMMHETKKNVRTAQRNLNESKGKKSYLFTAIFIPLAVIFILLFVAAIILFALLVAGVLILMAFAGIALICMSMPYMSGLTSVALVTLGIGLVLLSVPVLLFMPAMNFVFFVIKKAVIATFSMFNKQLGRKAAARK